MRWSRKANVAAGHAVDSKWTLTLFSLLKAQLAPLRERDLLIVGSGNIVHNLGRIDPRAGDRGFDWAQRFDDEARALLISAPFVTFSLLLWTLFYLDRRRLPDEGREAVQYVAGATAGQCRRLAERHHCCPRMASAARATA